MACPNGGELIDYVSGACSCGVVHPPIECGFCAAADPIVGECPRHPRTGNEELAPRDDGETQS